MMTSIMKNDSFGIMIKNKRILVMDDDELILSLVTSILEINDYSVETTVDGESAIKKYQQSFDENNPFDLILLDLTIPLGMGGKEAVCEILKIDPEAKCIASSGSIDDSLLKEFNDCGFTGILAKPFVMGELLAVLNEQLN